MSASLQITTLARVKAAAAQVGTFNDARIGEVIEGVSEFAESFLSRHLLFARRTEEVEVRRNQPLVWLRGMPIVTVHSIKYATRRRFTDAEALDSEDDYDIHADEGQIELRIPVSGDPGWILVDYEGGMAASTTEFVAEYGAIAEAATMECVNRLNRSTNPEGDLKSLGSEVAFQKPLEPLAIFLDALGQRRRFAA